MIESRPAADVPAVRNGPTIVVGRGVQRRVDITLVHGSILDVTTRAIVLGSFRNVDPGGAAKAVDAQLGGSLRELIRSRTVSSEPGSIFVLPTTRSGLRTDMVIFAGLGEFDRFEPSMIELVASNLVQTLVRGNVEEFTTVLFGAGSGFDAGPCTQHFLRGALGALRDLDGDHRFRGFTLCELDDGKFKQIRDEVYQGCREDYCSAFDVVVRERFLDVTTARAVAAPATEAEDDPVYLLVRAAGDGKVLTFKSAILTAGGKAAILEGESKVTRAELEDTLSVIETPSFDARALDTLGRSLGALVLAESVRTELSKNRGRHLAIVHDVEAARVPWETLRLGNWAPALQQGMSRRYVATDLAVGRWPEYRERQKQLGILLLVDPTNDLEGAVAEADRIQQIVGSSDRVDVTRIEKERVTRAAVLKELRSERFDVIHYAGHAFFDPITPGNSGIECADGTLKALDLLSLRSLPPLLFFNACESAKLRKPSRGRKKAERVARREGLDRTVGFAEALMRYGVANFIGTYWPVGDDAAATFAREFYGALLNGLGLADGLLAGRKAVQAGRSVDWADYIHYGDPRFRLKKDDSAPR